MTISGKVIGIVVATLSVLFVSACDFNDLYFTVPVEEQTTPDDSTHDDTHGPH